MGNGVRIGQHEVPCDSVVVATGFEPCYNFLPDAFKTHSVHERYLFTFHPELENVAFVGSVRGGIGSIPAGAEMQARWAALVFTGERRLPSEQDMEAWIVKHHERGLAKFPTEVTMVFANYLARHHVGCEPDLRKIFHVAAAVAPRRRVDDGAGAVPVPRAGRGPGRRTRCAKIGTALASCVAGHVPPGRARAGRGAALEHIVGTGARGVRRRFAAGRAMDECACLSCVDSHTAFF